MGSLLHLPPDLSANGPQIDNLITAIHVLMFVLFVGWGAFFAYTLIRFRKKRQPKAVYAGTRSRMSSFLEAGVAVFEGILLVGFAVPVWSARVNSLPDESKSTVVRVVAEQFVWNIHYPGSDGKFGRTDASLISPENPLGLDRTDPDAKDDIVTINQLNLPVGKPALIYLSTKDVIHSFALPFFRVKQDAIPGQRIPVWFVPVKTTEQLQEELSRTFKLAAGSVPRGLTDLSSIADYSDTRGNVIIARGTPFTDDIIPQLIDAGITEVRAGPGTPTEIACAQLCGLGHYRMRGIVTIQTQDEFNAWLAEQASYINQ